MPFKGGLRGIPMPRDEKMGKKGLRTEDSCGTWAVLRRGGGRRTSTNNFKSYFFGEQCRVTEFESLLYVRWCQGIKYCFACFRFRLFPIFTIKHFAARFSFPINRNPNPHSLLLLSPTSLTSIPFLSPSKIPSFLPTCYIASNTKKRRP